MTGSEDLIRQARSITTGALPKSPRKNTAVVACIDARVDPVRILGGEQGDYHVIHGSQVVVIQPACWKGEVHCLAERI